MALLARLEVEEHTDVARFVAPKGSKADAVRRTVITVSKASFSNVLILTISSAEHLLVPWSNESCTRSGRVPLRLMS